MSVRNWGLLDTEIECAGSSLVSLPIYSHSPQGELKKFLIGPAALHICCVQQERVPDGLATAVLSPLWRVISRSIAGRRNGISGCDDRLLSALTAKSLDPKPKSACAKRFVRSLISAIGDAFGDVSAKGEVDALCWMHA